MRVLVVVAHPDDEVLGVGGTIAAHVHRGDLVRIGILCEGVTLRYSPDRQAEVIRQSRQASEVLGVTDLVLRQFRDQHLDNLSLVEPAAEVEQMVSSFQPEVVYTHFGGDLNRDHRIVAEAVLVATRPCAAPGLREVLMFATPSSTEWGSRELLRVFHPNVYVDISDFLEQKLAAFSCYTAEVREFPHPRSLEVLRARALCWGSEVNRPAAEAFSLVRSVR